MKINVSIDPKHPAAAIGLKWQMPGEDVDALGYERSSLYLLPSELEPKAYPHAVKDLSRVAVFYSDHFALFYAPDRDYCRDFVAQTRVENVYCDTQKLLEVIRKLHAKRIPETDLVTDRFRSVFTDATLTVAELAAHPNLRNRDLLGKTLRYFRQVLAKSEDDGKRRCTFQNLMWDLSHYVRRATLVACGEEFYFDGRRAGGCGFNGGIIPHIHDNSYGIHT
jgi:hypothetical protein